MVKKNGWKRWDLLNVTVCMAEIFIFLLPFTSEVP
jgi:hypothetical protein